MSLKHLLGWMGATRVAPHALPAGPGGGLDVGLGTALRTMRRVLPSEQRAPRQLELDFRGRTPALGVHPLQPLHLAASDCVND